MPTWARTCSTCSYDGRWRGRVRPPSGALCAGHGRAAGEGGRNLPGWHVRTWRSCTRRAGASWARRAAAADGQGSRGDRRGRTRVRWRCARRDSPRQLRRPRLLGRHRWWPGWRAARPGRVVAATGCRRARLQLRQGRPAGHAHGSGQRRKRGAVARFGFRKKRSPTCSGPGARSGCRAGSPRRLSPAATSSR